MATAADDTVVGTTSTKVTTMEARLLRTSSVNGVASVVGITNNEGMHKQIVIMARIPKALGHWQGRCQAGMRSAATCVAWVVAELETGFLAHQFEMLAVLREQDYLKELGQYDYLTAAGLEAREGEITIAENNAALSGQYWMQLVAQCQRRYLYLSNGLSAGVFHTRGTEALQARFAEHFEQSWRDWEKLSPFGPAPEPLAPFLNRQAGLTLKHFA